jgi:hypothetical protein
VIVGGAPVPNTVVVTKDSWTTLFKSALRSKSKSNWMHTQFLPQQRLVV